jgi:hypothetical protein
VGFPHLRYLERTGKQCDDADLEVIPHPPLTSREKPDGIDAHNITGFHQAVSKAIGMDMSGTINFFAGELHIHLNIPDIKKGSTSPRM